MSENHRDSNPQTDPWSAIRRDMIRQQIVARGIKDPATLAALERIPRERFVPQNQRDAAYEDRALPIGLGQTISQPYIVACMTEMLDLQKGMKVLEVGTGSGYQTALLAAMGGRVHTIDRLAELSRTARQMLAELGLEAKTEVHCHVGDGSIGLKNEAPFDRILVTAAAPQIPPALLDQLVLGGQLVAPVGQADQQVLTRVVRQAGRTLEYPGLACRFVKLIGRQGWSESAPASGAVSSA